MAQQAADAHFAPRDASQLFGPEDETEEQELQKALANGENAEEIAKLQEESNQMKAIRSSLSSSSGSDDDVQASAARVFNKVFKQDVERLLSMEDMWKSRARPTPLDFAQASEWDSLTLKGKEEANTASAAAAAAAAAAPAQNGEASGSKSGAAAAEGLKDHQPLTLKQNVALFQRR